MHPCPRLLKLDGLFLKQQLVFGRNVCHEMSTLLIRRMDQIDSFCSKESNGMRWRKFVDPDFSVSRCLANAFANDFDFEPRQLVTTCVSFDATAVRPHGR